MIARLFTIFAMSLPSWVFAEEKITSGSSPVAAENLAQLAAGLVFVIVLIVLGAYLMKRMGISGSAVSGNLKVIGGLALGGREKVVLIEVGEEQVLVGVSPGRVQTLHVLKEPIVVENKPNNQFAEKLTSAMKSKS